MPSCRRPLTTSQLARRLRGNAQLPVSAATVTALTTHVSDASCLPPSTVGSRYLWHNRWQRAPPCSVLVQCKIDIGFGTAVDEVLDALGHHGLLLTRSVFAAGAGCSRTDGQCARDADCCGFDGVFIKCDDGACVDEGCLRASAPVRILESATPVALSEVKVGQHIECLDTLDNGMRLPTTPKFCEVMSWVHAEPRTGAHYRISFNKADGSPGSLTTSHLLYKLTSPAVAAGATAASLDKCEYGELAGGRSAFSI